jgi:LuxR family maltose regulon positive regulatory protein
MVATGLAIEGIPPARYANTLAEACIQLPHAVVLALDDYHLITAPDIHAVIAHLIRHTSSRLHLVIVARHDPPLSVPLLRARQQLAEVRAGDLRLTDAEAANLLQQRVAEALAPELVSVLQARTEGWVAGLQLAAASLKQVSQAEFLASFRRHESMHLIDFFVDEVLDHAPAEVREFMLKTALVARFNVDLAALMTESDVSVSSKILDYLRRANLFLVSLDDTGVWFRYHHQFRAMLVNRSARLLSSEIRSSIRGAAIEWLASHGWIDEALAEYSADGRWDSAADLVEADRHPLQNRHEWHLLWRRLQQLPDAVVAQRPGLLLAKAWILHINYRYAAMSTAVEQAACLLSAAPSSAGSLPVEILWGEINILRAAHFMLDVSGEQQVALLQETLTVLAPVGKYECVRGFTFVALANALLAVGGYEAAYRQVMREITAVDLGSARYQVRLYHVLAIIAFYDASLAEMKQTSSRYLQVALELELPLPMAWARFGLGWCHFQNCDPAEDIFAILHPVYQRIQSVHLHTALLALPMLVAAAVECGRDEDIRHIMEQMAQLAMVRENILALDEIAASTAYAALLRQDRFAASAWASEFMAAKLSILTESNDLWLRKEMMVICVKILLVTGSHAQLLQSIESLQLVVDYARRRGIKVDILQCAVLLACCYWRTNQPVKALDWMQQALDIGMPRGFRRVYFEQGAVLAEILYALLQRRAGAEAASTLLAEYGAWSGARKSGAPAPPSANGAAIHVLTEREMEILALLADHLSNKEIATRLNISSITVRNHTSNIYSKLDVNSRRSAVARARTLHLLA